MNSITTTLLAFFLYLIISPQGLYSQELTIGLIAEQTGDYAITGKDCMQGFKLAQDLYAPVGKAGHIALRYVIGDSVGAAGPGLTEFKRITETENASLVILTRSTVALAVNPVSLSKKIPILGVAAHPRFTTDNRFAFRFYPNANDEGKLLSEFAAERGKLLAIISAEDDFLISLKNSFESNFKVNGGKTVYSETILPTELNFNSYALKIKNKKTRYIILKPNPSTDRGFY